MTMIKCAECGKDISDTAPACIGCGAPLAPSRLIGDLDGDGKIGLNDVRIALDRIRNNVVTTTELAVEQGKELLKSREQKDSDAIDELKLDINSDTSKMTPESAAACNRFQAALRSTIDVTFADIMRGKTGPEKFVTYVDGQVLTASVRNIFVSALGIVPPQIEAACCLSEAILSPSFEEKQRLIKAAVGIGGGATGIAMIIAGAGSALGWGAGVVASVTAFFVGTALAGPIGWAVAGITVAGVAAYFATTNDKHIDTERFLKVLKSSTSRAVVALWPEHAQALSKVMPSDAAP